MNNHPLNLALRFLLELFSLFVLGYGGFHLGHSGFRYLWMLLIPLATALIWGIFRADMDPGKAVISIPGKLRLLIEFVFFGISSFFIYQSGYEKGALIFTVILLLHYTISYDRVIKLWKQ